MKKGKFIACKICGKKCYCKKSYIPKFKYCSYPCRNKADSINFTGKGNPFFGKTHNKDYKFKGEYKYCEICNERIRLIPSRKKNKRGRFCSIFCYSIAKSKEVEKMSNPNWKGGISKEPYAFEFDKELKEKIRKRDNYECQICHITEEEHIIVFGEVLSIHHIDYDKKNCKENNLKSLCKQCNSRVNYNREYWKEYFKNGEREAIIPDFPEKNSRKRPKLFLL